MIRAAVQSFLRSRGYRIVARARDPQSILQIVYQHPVDAVIDVGANTGDTCAEWLERFPGAQVFGFEPLPQYQLIIEQKTRRWADRFKLFQIAASAETGEEIFHIHTDHPSSSSLLPTTDAASKLMPFTAQVDTIRVQTDRLDNVLSRRHFREAVLKLDVQGNELAVLDGAAETLRSVQFVLSEVNLQPLYRGQPTFGEINAFLQERGFAFIGVAEQFHLDDGRPIFLDALFERRP